MREARGSAPAVSVPRCRLAATTVWAAARPGPDTPTLAFPEHGHALAHPARVLRFGQSGEAGLAAVFRPAGRDGEGRVNQADVGVRLRVVAPKNARPRIQVLRQQAERGVNVLEPV